MKKNIFILALLLTIKSLFAQEVTIIKTDSLFFDLNMDYVKQIAIDYGSKKDRLYLLSEPQIQSHIFFEIDRVCLSKKSLDIVETIDLKFFLQKQQVLTNDNNLNVSVGKLFRALKPYKVFFIDNKKLYKAILTKEEI